MKIRTAILFFVTIIIAIFFHSLSHSLLDRKLAVYATPINASVDNIRPVTNNKRNCYLPRHTYICRKERRRDSKTDSYLVNPYPTRLLNDRPTFSWQEVPSANRYVLRVDLGNGTQWEREVSELELIYPDDVPPLTPNRMTQVILTPYEDEFTALRHQIIAFQLISEDEVAEMKILVNEVMSSNLSPEKAAQELDEIYVKYGLWNEAIENLEAVVEKGTQQAEIYLLLGERYRNLGLVNEAELQYVKALELAEISGNIEELERAQLGLDMIRNKN